MPETLRALDVATPLDREFLAGMIQARGKCYVGSTLRNGKTKWSPSLSLEVSGNPAKHWALLLDVFGAPKERRYYSTSCWRYVTQDRAKIDAILSALTFKAGFADTAAAMVKFCRAQTDAEEKKCAARLQDVAEF